MEVQLCSFLILVLDGVSCQLHALASFSSTGRALQYPLIGVWVASKCCSGYIANEINLVSLLGILRCPNYTAYTVMVPNFHNAGHLHPF